MWGCSRRATSCASASKRCTKVGIVGQLGSNHLDCDLAPDTGLRGPEHGAERALPEHVAQHVAVGSATCARWFGRRAGGDRALEVDQRRRGLQARLLTEMLAEVVIGPERFGLSTRHQSRPHELGDRTLAEWVRGLRNPRPPIPRSASPKSNSASIRSSFAAIRSSSKRAAIGWAHHSPANSPNAGPRHSPSAWSSTRQRSVGAADRAAPTKPSNATESSAVRGRHRDGSPASRRVTTWPSPSAARRRETYVKSVRAPPSGASPFGETVSSRRSSDSIWPGADNKIASRRRCCARRAAPERRRGGGPRWAQDEELDPHLASLTRHNTSNPPGKAMVTKPACKSSTGPRVDTDCQRSATGTATTAT